MPQGDKSKYTDKQERKAAALVALLDMLSFPLLLIGVFRLVSSRHGSISCAALQTLTDEPMNAVKVPRARPAEVAHRLTPTRRAQRSWIAGSHRAHDFRLVCE